MTCNKICENCMFFETYFENWSPMDMCEHVIYRKPSILYNGTGETRGLDTIENVRYNEKLCGINGRWYVERQKGFDELPYDERKKIRKQNE